MCNPASFVLTKDRVFWSKKSDSHEEIICEHGLVESKAMKANILRVEITPPDNDFSKPLSEWIFRLDQNLFPPWFDKASDEKRARAELEEWFKVRVLLAGVREISEGHIYAFGSASVMAFGSASVMAFDSASVEARGSASVMAFDSASVRACKEKATVCLFEKATSSKPVGAWAVVVDRTGDEVKVLKGKDKK